MNYIVYKVLDMIYRKIMKIVRPVVHYSTIETAEQFAARGVAIGKNSGIGKDCILVGPITIKDDVMMAWGVTILTRNHKHDRTDIPMNRQGDGPVKPVVIGNDVLICKGVTILPGVHVGDHAILGANATITKDVPAWAIMGTPPARVIGWRKKSN